MAVIKHPQHDLPPDLLLGRISGASVEQCNDILVDEFFGAEVAINPTGTMAAVESGADAFAASGDVFVQGSMAASETGADTLAASGKVVVQGMMAGSDAGSDVAAMSGAVIVTGTMEAAEIGDDIAVILGPVTAKQKRGGSTARKRTAPKHIVSTVESDEDRARALAEIMADEPTVSATPAPTPAPAPTFTPQPLPAIDLAPVIAAAQQAIENAAQGAALQVAALEAQRLAALQAQREEIARQAAQAILAARLRDEDEATALIFIMATA